MAASSSGMRIHLLLMQSGDYSDDANSSAMDDDDEYDNKSDNEHEASASTVVTDWQQRSGSKRKQKQNEFDTKKSKLDTAKSSVTRDDISEASYVAYVRGHTIKLTNRNPITAVSYTHLTLPTIYSV